TAAARVLTALPGRLGPPSERSPGATRRVGCRSGPSSPEFPSAARLTLVSVAGRIRLPREQGSGGGTAFGCNCEQAASAGLRGRPPCDASAALRFCGRVCFAPTTLLLAPFGPCVPASSSA